MELKDKGIIDNNNIFKQSYEFYSPSLASDVCAGGRNKWTNNLEK